MPQTFCASCNKPSIRSDEEGQVHFAICPRCPHYAVIRLVNSSIGRPANQNARPVANDNERWGSRDLTPHRLSAASNQGKLK